jgi:hypothetical protein
MSELVERADKPGVIGARGRHDVLRRANLALRFLQQKRIGAQAFDKFFPRAGGGQGHLLRRGGQGHGPEQGAKYCESKGGSHASTHKPPAG